MKIRNTGIYEQKTRQENLRRTQSCAMNRKELSSYSMV